VETLDYLYNRGKPTSDPILVLLDSKMPKISGLQVLKTIKADEQLKMIPVIALTYSRLTSDLIEFYKHGANVYVMKPVGFSEFVTAIKQLCVFWMAANEPPPVVWQKEAGVQNGNGTFLEKKKGGKEISASYPALVPARVQPFLGSRSSARSGRWCACCCIVCRFNCMTVSDCRNSS
jgi:CheY-like chemotaxis protein